MLESFLEYMPEKPIILYPTGANIIQAGDKAEYMLLLVKGRSVLFPLLASEVVRLSLVILKNNLEREVLWLQL